MSDSSNPVSSAVNSVYDGQIQDVCSRFEAAWKQTHSGGSQPTIEEFIEQAPAPVKSRVMQELQRIDNLYRVSASVSAGPSGEGTLELSPYGPRVDLPPTVAEETIDKPPPTATSEGTIEYSSAAAEAAENTHFSLSEAIEARSAAGLPLVAGHEVLEELGHGGMGVVYKARHIRLNRLVALKMLIGGAHAGQHQLMRFYTEAEAVAKLHHPNIVQIHDVGEQDGLPYFSLEYIAGGSLAEKIAGAPQAPREAARLMVTLAGAMAYAHENGVMHRDLKPANILLTRDGTPKITDFGLAKHLESDSSQTKSGTLLGTPSYMAPEQARGDTKLIGPSADVYSLGALLYELVTGRPPFMGASILDTLQQVRHQEPVPPSRLQPSLPSDLETICLKCLQKEPRKRYDTAALLAEDLRRFLAGDTIRARPVSGPERVWRWCRRNPRVAALSASVLMLLVVIAVTSTGLAIKISQEKAETERQRQDAVRAREIADERTREAQAARELADKNAQAAEHNAKVAEVNAKIASDQGGLAVNALYTAVTKIQNRLRGQGQQAIRQDLLKDALAGLERVVSSSGSSALIDRTKAAACQRMGDIYLEMGNSEAALQQYNRCRTLVEGMAKLDPDSDAVIWNLAVVQDKLGNVYHQLQGDAAVALRYHRRCLELREKLRGMALKTPELKPQMVTTTLTETYAKLGNLLLRLGDPVQAWDFYRKSLELQTGRHYKLPRESLAGASSKVPATNALSADLCLQLGRLCFHLGEDKSTEEFYERAMSLGRKRQETETTRNAAKREIAGVQAALGDLRLAQGRTPEALDCYRQAHKYQEEAVAADPENVGLRANLALSHYRLGTALLRSGNGSEAKAEFQKVLQIRTALVKADPHNRLTNLDLLLIKARSGNHDEADEGVAKLYSKVSNDPALLFHMACCYALCTQTVSQGSTNGQLSTTGRALRTRYTTRAIELLNQALAHGYKDVVALKTDPDLEPVRNHEEFTRLVDKLAKQ